MGHSPQHYYDPVLPRWLHVWYIQIWKGECCWSPFHISSYTHQARQLCTIGMYKLNKQWLTTVFDFSDPLLRLTYEYARPSFTSRNSKFKAFFMHNYIRTHTHTHTHTYTHTHQQHEKEFWCRYGFIAQPRWFFSSFNAHIIPFGSRALSRRRCDVFGRWCMHQIRRKKSESSPESGDAAWRSCICLCLTGTSGCVEPGAKQSSQPSATGCKL